MKKTLIALAVAASAVVSGSAMAWTANGSGGNVELGGTLTPQEKMTPWAVEVGGAVNGLDAQIQKGQKVANITATKAIPLLGIRTANAEVFMGQEGIAPQINYGGAVNLDGFTSNGQTTLTLPVKNEQAQDIGQLTAPMSVGALLSYKNGDTVNTRSLFASAEGKLFWGGLPKTADAVMTYPISGTSGFFAAASANYLDQGSTSLSEPGESRAAVPNATYSGFYASGIYKDAKIQIKLDAPAAADAIVWKASLPVTVSYQ
ncbi:fimbrial protein [Salmonella enterica]|nr:fimbrial protein [Salmonella enterica]